jgi:Tfp pilus assembly protein FimT
VTLIELILVVMILFVLAGVVAPRFSDFFPALQVRKTADHLFAWAQKARADAALLGMRHRLVLDASARRYWIERETRPLKDPGVFEALGGSWTPETLPEDVGFERLTGLEKDGQRDFLEFRPDGTSSDAEIGVANDRGDRVVIQVTGATSLVRIVETASP